MTSKRQYNRKQWTDLPMVVLVTVAGLFSILISLPNTPQIQALGDSQSTQISCIDNQPCQTVVCSETQPCRVSQSPNTDFDAAETSVSRPLEGTESMCQRQVQVLIMTTIIGKTTRNILKKSKI
jgi:hypothetical protein